MTRYLCSDGHQSLVNVKWTRPIAKGTAGCKDWKPDTNFTNLDMLIPRHYRKMYIFNSKLQHYFAVVHNWHQVLSQSIGHCSMKSCAIAPLVLVSEARLSHLWRKNRFSLQVLHRIHLYGMHPSKGSHVYVGHSKVIPGEEGGQSFPVCLILYK